MRRTLLKIIIFIAIFITIFGNESVNADYVDTLNSKITNLEKQMNDPNLNDGAKSEISKQIEATKKEKEEYESAGKITYSPFNYGSVGNGGKDVGVSNAQTILGSIITIVRVVGTGVAIIMLIWLGIHYMVGAPDEKVQVKKTMVPYVVGAVVLFAGSNLLAIIAEFATKNI